MGTSAKRHYKNINERIEHIKERVNNFGKMDKTLPFHFVEIKKIDQKKIKLVVENDLTKERKEISFYKTISKNINPFRVSRERSFEYKKEKIEKKFENVQKIGEFEVLSVDPKNYRNCLIKSKLTKEHISFPFRNLLKGENPFLNKYIFEKDLIANFLEQNKKIDKIKGNHFLVNKEKIWVIDNYIKIEYRIENSKRQTGGFFVKQIVFEKKSEENLEGQILKINNFGKLSNNIYEQFKFVRFGEKRGKIRKVVIQNLKTLEEKESNLEMIYKKSNPFSVVYRPSEAYIEHFCEELSKSFNKKSEKFKYKYNKVEKNKRMIYLENLEGLEKKISYSQLLKRKNPFKKYSKEELKEISAKKVKLSYQEKIKKINDFVQKEKEEFKFSIEEIDKSNNRIKIKSIQTGEVISLRFSTLAKERNPFREKYIGLNEISLNLKNQNKKFVKIIGESFKVKDKLFYIFNEKLFLFYEDNGVEKKIFNYEIKSLINGTFDDSRFKNLIEKVNSFGIKYKDLNESFEFLNFKNEDFVEDEKKAIVLNKISGETRLVSLRSLLKNNSPFNVDLNPTKKYIKDKVNEIGQSSDKLYFEKFSYVDDYKKNPSRIVIIKNDFTGETQDVRLYLIRQGSNPFNRGVIGYPDQYIIEKTNEIGNSYESIYEKFVFDKFLKQTDEMTSTEKRFLIKNLKANEVKETSFANILSGNNPFNQRSERSEVFVIDQVNEIGQNQEEGFKFEYVKLYSHLSSNGKDNSNKRIVVKNIKTGEEVVCNLPSLLRFKHSPFSLTADLDELRRVQPKIAKDLKRMKISFQKEIMIGEGSKIDFLCFIGDFVFGIEAKSDKKHSNISKGNLDQVERYSKQLKEKYGDKFLEVFLVSLEGQAGMKWDETKEIIKVFVEEFK